MKYQPTRGQRQIYNPSADPWGIDVPEQVPGDILSDYCIFQHKAAWISKLCKSVLLESQLILSKLQPWCLKNSITGRCGFIFPVQGERFGVFKPQDNVEGKVLGRRPVLAPTVGAWWRKNVGVRTVTDHNIDHHQNSLALSFVSFVVDGGV